MSKSEVKIEKIIGKRHLIDSLIKTDSLRVVCRKVWDDYWTLRRKVSDRILDSLTKIRTLTKTEKYVLESITDPYYDGHEEQCGSLRNNTDEENRQRTDMIKIWDDNIPSYRFMKKNVLPMLFLNWTGVKRNFSETTGLNSPSMLSLKF